MATNGVEETMSQLLHSDNAYSTKREDDGDFDQEVITPCSNIDIMTKTPITNTYIARIVEGLCVCM